VVPSAGTAPLLTGLKLGRMVRNHRGEGALKRIPGPGSPNGAFLGNACETKVEE
jgi:hypothetical protein